MKFLVVVLITVFFLGCGVETDSSFGDSTTTSEPGTGDGNSTDDNTTDGSGTGVVVDDPSSSGFDQNDAELDSSACIINATYEAIDDSSFDPLANADVDNGLEIASQYNYSTDLEATKVALFYPELTVVKLDINMHIYEESYRFSFDKAWPSNDLASIYIRTPQNIYGTYSCYRYDLDSLSGDTITKTKVYR